MRRSIVLLSIVLLAGCLSGGNLGAQETEHGPPDTRWTDGQGINATVLAHSHFETLRSEGNFTLNRTSSIAIDGDTRPKQPRPDWYAPPSYTHAKVNLDESRLLHRSIDAGHSQATRFISAEETTRRRKPCSSNACDWEYHYTKRPEHDTVAQLIDRYRRDRVVEMMVNVMDDWNYTYEETTERNGRTVYRYTAKWTFDKSVHPYSEQPTGTGTLLVSQEGVVIAWQYQYTGPAELMVDGERQTVNVTRRDVQTYTSVGETTVKRPEWVAAAKEWDPVPTTETADT